MTYLPDTNILIGVITGRRPYAAMLEQAIVEGHTLATCSIVVSEVYSGMRPAEAARTSELLRSLLFLPIDYEIARDAGMLRRDAAKQGRSLSLADTTIAAVAMKRECCLITENGKDFPFPGLRILVPGAPSRSAASRSPERERSLNEYRVSGHASGGEWR